MLSFSRVSNASFSGAACVPATEMSRQRPTLTIQVESKKAIPASQANREKFMVSLMTDYACRWRAVMDPSLPVGNEDAETTAFYGAIAELNMDRRRVAIGNCAQTCAANEAATETALKLAVEEYTLVASNSKCKSAALHDWSSDTITKRYMQINSRPHVLAHLIHPCACAGRELLPLTAEEAEAYSASASTAANQEQASMANRLSNNGTGAGTTTDPLFRELLQRVNTVRSTTSPDEIVSKIETTLALRKQAATAQKLLSAFKHPTSPTTVSQCSNFLQRARHVQRLRAAGFSESNSEEDNSSDASISRSNSNDASEIVGEYDGDDSSATFSDEDETASDTGSYDSTSSSGSTEEELPALETTVAYLEETVEEDTEKNVVAATANDEEQADQNKEKGEPAKQLVLRQTKSELMIPICQAIDSIEMFDKLECNFVAQWAPADDLTPVSSKIHLFRKQKITSSYMLGLFPSVTFKYHLIATIAAIQA